MAKLPPMNLPGPAVPWGREVQRQAQSNQVVSGQLKRAAQRAFDVENVTKGIALDGSPVVEDTRQALMVPAGVTGLTAEQVWVWDAFKNPTASLNLTWHPLTLNANGEPMTVPTFEIWLLPEGSTSFVQSGTSEDFDATIERLAPETTYTAKVRGVSQYGVPGPFSEEVIAAPPAPLAPLPAPTNPVLQTAYGVVVASWDGLLAGGVARPVHFDYVDALMAEAPEGPWTHFGHQMRTANSVQQGNLPPTEMRYVKFHAHDRSGGVGADSNVVSIEVVGVDLGALDAQLDQLEEDLATNTADLAAAEADIDEALNGAIDGGRIISRTIIGEKILAESITALEIGARTITTDNIGAEQITGDLILGRTIEGKHIMGETIEGNSIIAGTVTTNQLSPAVGAELDISANSYVNIIVGRIDTNSATVDAIGNTQEDMIKYYSFGEEGAKISTPNSPFSLLLDNDRIEMQENGVAVSWWENQEMHVRSFIGEEVILGNHKLEKYGAGTVVRAL